jgi:PAS domain S-box-containing protein
VAAPAIEPSARAATSLAGQSTAEELAYRLAQQQKLSDFGLHALQSTSEDELLQQATRIAAEALRTQFCKILQYMPEQDRLFVRAGVGWRAAVVGRETVGADLESPAGYAFQTGEPVISNHLQAETRFRTPRLLAEHGIRRAINVLIRGEQRSWGVLEVDTPNEGRFDEADLTFLRGMASLIGVALEKKRVEATLQESERQFRTLADAIPQLAWMADEAGSIFWYNQRWYDYTGTQLDEVRGRGWTKVNHPEHVDRVVEGLGRSFQTGEPWEDTFPLRRHDGEYRWFLSRALPIGADGRLVRWFGTNTDVTEAREADERQRLVTQEVSHRVKNSLQLVASLLGLQSRSSASGEVRSALDDAQARVATIAQIHDRLWRQYDAKTTDLCGFLNDLCHRLQETSLEHQLRFKGTSVSVPTDQAISIGLLLNELVTNAFKYAYPEGGGGPVSVELGAESEGAFKLSVSDQGAGLPEDFDLAMAGRSLGMRLLNTMTRQLEATVEVVRLDPGTSFELTIPVRRAT